MYGGEGSDIYYIDDPNDYVSDSGKTGSDTLYVMSYLESNYKLGDGLDDLVIDSTAGNVSVTGNSLDNEITGNDSKNTIDGGGGKDVIDGGGGNDNLAGGDGNDNVNGDQGNDVIVGGQGNDNLNGSAGVDKLIGIDLSDKTFGGGSRDELTGGTQNDTFVLGNSSGVFYSDGSRKSAGRSDYAWINDFTRGDKIQLKGKATNYQIQTETFTINNKEYSGFCLYLDDGSNKGFWDSTDELIGFIQTKDKLALSNSSLGAIQGLFNYE
jgi:Ca2+-binding RTX toxin-like protein